MAIIMLESNFTKKTNIKAIILNEIKECFSFKITKNTNEEELLNQIAQIINKNKTIIQIYPQNITVKKFIKIAQKIQQLCSIYNTPLIIKSRPDIAKILDCSGVCLDLDDYNISDAYKIIDHDKLCGCLYKKCENGILDELFLCDYILVNKEDLQPLKANLGSENTKIIIQMESDL